MEKYLYQDLYDLEESHWWHLSKRELALKLIKKYLKKRKSRILDVGCGTGKTLESLTRLGEVCGCDISPEAIKFCKKRGLLNVKLASADKLDFPSSYFNLVTIFDVLEHTDDKKSTREIYRILKGGGLLILTVPAFNWLWSNWDVVLHHRRRYTKKSLSLILEKEGFYVLKISYMYSFLVFPVLIIRFIKSQIFKKDYPSDFKLSNSFVNRLLLWVARAERGVVSVFGLPLGTSLICVAKKME